MRDGELTAVGKLAGQVVGGPASLARGLHTVVAGRVFGALGILGAPVRVAHDAISQAAYRSVGGMLEAPLRAGAAALTRAGLATDVSLADSPRGRIALAALNGALGDRLASEAPALALGMAIRRGGRDVAPHELATAFPDATAKVAVLVHGLCETDDAWRLPPLMRGGRRRASYGSRLREELGYTPVYLRYNTGLRVSDNGRRLAGVLDALHREWPVPIEELALFGHSMGGLVSRSACYYGEHAGQPWTATLRHVFCLGTPHLGAPLEKAANVAGWALARVPETRPLAGVVNGRSVGIKDLRYGSCVEEDWCDCDPDELLRDRCCEVPFLPHATYHFVGATLARRTDGPFANIVGDLLVRFPSASGDGRTRRIPFEIENGCHIGRINHFQLLNHPAVYAQIRAWISAEPAGEPAHAHPSARDSSSAPAAPVT
jgi:hypothetical protein